MGPAPRHPPRHPPPIHLWEFACWTGELSEVVVLWQWRGVRARVLTWCCPLPASQAEPQAEPQAKSARDARVGGECGAASGYDGDVREPFAMKMTHFKDYKFIRSFSTKAERWPMKKAEQLWRRLRERKIAGEGIMMDTVIFKVALSTF